MAAWWYRNTSDSDDTHNAPASVIAQRVASPRRKSTTGPGRTPPLSCDDAHSTSSKGGRADPAAIAAAAASAAGAAPSAVAVTLGCITRAAAAHRLVLIQRRLELQASGTGVVVVRLPNVGAGGRGQSRYEERDSERREGPASEQQPA